MGNGATFAESFGHFFSTVSDYDEITKADDNFLRNYKHFVEHSDQKLESEPESKEILEQDIDTEM